MKGYEKRTNSKVQRMPGRTERWGALLVGYRPLCTVWTSLCGGDRFLFLSKRLMYQPTTAMDKSDTATNGSCQSISVR